MEENIAEKGKDDPIKQLREKIILLLNEKGQILPDEINNIIGGLECPDYNLVSQVLNSLVHDKIIWISFIPISGQVYFGVRLHSKARKELSGLSVEVTSLEKIEKP